MKRRLSVSLDDNVVKRIDSYVDGIVIKSRSAAIERFLNDNLKDRRTCVILAGGDPETMKVDGLETLRPLVTVGNGRKLIEDLVLKAREAGYHNHIIVGSSKVISKIYELLGDGKRYDVNITYLEEKEARGSAKTLELAKPYLKSDFLVLPCDHYFDFDLKKVRDLHTSSDAGVTLAIHTRADYQSELGMVELDGNKIVRYDEQPTEPRTNLFSTLIGFFSPDIFDYIPPGEIGWSLQSDVFPKLSSEGKMIGYPTSGQWINVHTKEDVNKI